MLVALLACLSVPATASALGDGQARTPPMGWSSWNHFTCTGVNEQMVRQSADAMVSSGMRRAGYRYVNVDDRDRAGRQDRRVRSSRGRDVWVKRLKGGSRAVLLVNRGSRRARLSASLRRVGMPQARHYRARDLWRHSSRKTGRVLRATVAPHGVASFKVRAAR